MEEGQPAAKPALTRRTLLRAALAGAVVLVALVAWLATRGGGGESSPAARDAQPAQRIVSDAELREAAADLGQPIYWVGPIPGTELDLKELEGGGVQVAYQQPGTGAAGGSSQVLTIGSYPVADPKAAIEGYGQRPGAIVREGKSGTEVVSNRSRPTSAYFAAPDNSVQVEVYDPAAPRAMEFALSGKATPVE